MSNLVDSMLAEVHQSNPDHVLNYSPVNGQQMQPGMMQQGYSPIQPDQHVRMGEVQYQNQGNQPMYPQMPGNQPPPQSLAQQEQFPDENDNDNVIDAPDLTSYGMDNGASSIMEQIITQAKGPLIVVVLAFVMSLPQVSGTVRSLVARFTTNSIYVNIALALIMGLVFFLINKLIT